MLVLKVFINNKPCFVNFESWDRATEKLPLPCHFPITLVMEEVKPLVTREGQHEVS